MSMWVRLGVVVILFFSCTNVRAQEVRLPKQIVISKTIKLPIDSLVLFQTIKKTIAELHQKGYLLAHVDSSIIKNDSLILYISVGSKFYWSTNSPNFGKVNLTSRASTNIFNLKDAKWSQQRVNLFFDKIISDFENNGYPFAYAYFDSLNIKDSLIKANFVLHQGPNFVFDTINMPGVNTLKQSFISSFLRIKKGQTFDQSKVNSIEKQLKSLPFVQLKDKPFVNFYKNNAFVVLPITVKKINQVDGIIGLLPNSSQNNSRPLLTGEFNLALRNLFNSGKTFKGEWRRFQPQSQLLNVAYYHPVILKSNIDLSLNLDFIKQDSTFLNIYRKLSLAYEIPIIGKLSFFTALRTSRVGTTKAFKSSNTLTNTLDYDHLTYGVGYNYFNLDNYFRPKSGNRVFIQIEVGNKKIIKNTGVENQIIYDSISLNSVQWSGTFNYEYYKMLSKRLVWASELKSKWLYNNNGDVFINDLYRLGGFMSLRGFNENFFFASNYAILSSELRTYIDQSSYIFTFINGAFFNQQLKQSYYQDYPIGFGLGLSLSTGAGQFNLIYSLGQSKEQQINFNQSKIHIGLVSSF